MGIIRLDLLRNVATLEKFSPIKRKLVFCYVFLTVINFRFIFFFRIASFLYEKTNLLYKLCFLVVNAIRKHYCYKLGIILLPKAKIGGGLFFPHFSSIIMTSHAKYGKNLTVFQQVTIGLVFGGEKEGAPVIGNNVVISAGAKVLGNIHIGNNVMIGAGAVVVTDIPDNAVVVGNPGKIISFNGPEKVSYYIPYINQ